MYTNEEKEKALKIYEEVRSVTKVIQKLGYPTREGFYKWLRESKNPSEKVKAPQQQSRSPVTPAAGVKIGNNSSLL